MNYTYNPFSIQAIMAGNFIIAAVFSIFLLYDMRFGMGLCLTSWALAYMVGYLFSVESYGKRWLHNVCCVLNYAGMTIGAFAVATAMFTLLF